jgi:hypothetical protein
VGPAGEVGHDGDDVLLAELGGLIARGHGYSHFLFGVLVVHGVEVAARLVEDLFREHISNLGL